MKAVYIYPEDLKMGRYSIEWVEFCEKFGIACIIQTSPDWLLLTNIQTNL